MINYCDLWMDDCSFILLMRVLWIYWYLCCWSWEKLRVAVFCLRPSWMVCSSCLCGSCYNMNLTSVAFPWRPAENDVLSKWLIRWWSTRQRRRRRFGGVLAAPRFIPAPPNQLCCNQLAGRGAAEGTGAAKC